ncbi:MAG TPA: Uma2 family endonuclease [Oscillatoriales cyanobacterium M59_W2019_021]|nr:Uma2 family endonuclease [Oscillatoriales cyanobacterium M4454_W2019_049]HIK52522.1 Uma2 family endonuclease [Oscillatoriales cyanobacterium M59_W2019_021]
MILQVEHQKVYTPDEYLDLEVNSDLRHEYIDGEIVNMTGGTPNHNQIAGNLYAALNFALKRQPYRVFVTDQRLWIPRKTIYTYPDIMVVSGDLQFQEGRQDTILNPVFIAEVLSPSTRSYDKTDKFSAYRTISTFQEYLLIEQSQIHVEHYVKNDRKRWTFSEYDEAEEVIALNSIDFQIFLTDLYDKVEFDSEVD